MNDHITCTAPDCKRHQPAEHMWLPERKARAVANGGKRVDVSDFPKFALCGRHGHLLRKENVRVYRYADEVKREAESAERRVSEASNWKPFADRFVLKTKQKGNGATPTPRDGSASAP